MKLTLDLSNLEGVLQESLELTVKNAVDEAIKSMCNQMVSDNLKELIKEGVGEKISQYVDEYMATTKIEIGGGFWDSTPKETLTVEEYIKRQLSSTLDKGKFYIRDGYSNPKEVSFSEYVNNKFNLTSEVDARITKFMEDIKYDVNKKIKQQFDDATKKTLSDTMIQLLSANDTFVKIQENIACIATK